MTKKEVLLGFAARIDQLHRELYAFGKNPEFSLSASHMIGTVAALLSIASSRLTKLSDQ